MYSPEEKDPHHSALAAQNVPTFFARAPIPISAYAQENQENQENQKKLFSIALSAISQNKVPLLEVLLQSRYKDLLHYYEKEVESAQLGQDKSKQNTLKTSLVLGALTAFHINQGECQNYSQEDLQALEQSLTTEWMALYKAYYEDLDSYVRARSRVGNHERGYVFEAKEGGLNVDAYEEYIKDKRPSLSDPLEELDKLLKEMANLKTKALLESHIGQLQSKLIQCNEEEGAFVEQLQRVGLWLSEYQEKYPDLEAQAARERSEKIATLLEGAQGPRLLEVLGSQAQALLESSSLNAFGHYPSAQGEACLFQYPLSMEKSSAAWDFLLKRYTWMKQSAQQGQVLSLQAIDESSCWHEACHLAQETGLWPQALWYEARAYLVSGSITDKLAYQQLYAHPQVKEEDKQAFFAALIRSFFGVGRVLDLLEEQGFVDLKKSKELGEADKPLMAYVLGRDLKELLEWGFGNYEADQGRLACLLKEEKIPSGLKIQVINEYLPYYKFKPLDRSSVLAEDLPGYLRQALSHLLEGWDMPAINKELHRLLTYDNLLYLDPKTQILQALAALEGLNPLETLRRFCQSLSFQRILKEHLGCGLTPEGYRILEEGVFGCKGMSPFRELIQALDRELGIAESKECKDEEKSSPDSLPSQAALPEGRALSTQRLTAPQEPTWTLGVEHPQREEDRGFEAFGVARQTLVYKLLLVLKEGRGPSTGLESLLGAAVRERLLSGELDELARASDKLEKELYLAEQLMHQQYEEGFAVREHKKERLKEGLATGTAEQKKEAGQALQGLVDEEALRARNEATAQQTFERHSCTPALLKAFIQFYLGEKGALPVSLAIWYGEQHPRPSPASTKEGVRGSQWKLGALLAILDYVYAQVSGAREEESLLKRRVLYFSKALQEAGDELPLALLEKEFYFAANKPGVVCTKHLKLRALLGELFGRNSRKARTYERMSHPAYVCLQAVEELKGLLPSLSKDPNLYAAAVEAERQSSSNLEWLQQNPWASWWSLFRDEKVYRAFLEKAQIDKADLKGQVANTLPQGINNAEQFEAFLRIQNRLQSLGLLGYGRLGAWGAHLPWLGVSEKAYQQMLRRPSMQQDLELILRSKSSLEVLTSLSPMRDEEAAPLILSPLSQGLASRFYGLFCEKVEQTIANPDRTKALLRSITFSVPGVSEKKGGEINLHAEFIRLGWSLEQGGEQGGKIYPVPKAEVLEQDKEALQKKRLPITQHLGFRLIEHLEGLLSFIKPRDHDKFALFLLEMLFLYLQDQEGLKEPWDLFDWLARGPNLFVRGVLYEGPEIELIGTGKARCMSLLRESGFQCVEVPLQAAEAAGAEAEAKAGEEESIFYYALRTAHLLKPPVPEKYGFKNATPSQAEFLNQEILRLRGLAPWYPERKPDGSLAQEVWLDEKIVDVLPDEPCLYRVRTEKYSKEEIKKQHRTPAELEASYHEEIKKLREQSIADIAQMEEKIEENQAKMAAERAADQAKLAADKAADQAKLVADKAADQAKIAAEKVVDQANLAADKAIEQAKVAEKSAFEKKKIEKDKEQEANDRAGDLADEDILPFLKKILEREAKRARATADEAKEEANQAQQEAKQARQEATRVQEAADEARRAFERQYPSESGRRGSGQEFFSHKEGSGRKHSAGAEEQSKGYVPG